MVGMVAVVVVVCHFIINHIGKTRRGLPQRCRPIVVWTNFGEWASTFSNLSE